MGLRLELLGGIDGARSRAPVDTRPPIQLALVGEDLGDTTSFFFTRRVVSDRDQKQASVSSEILRLKGIETLQRPWHGH